MYGACLMNLQYARKRNPFVLRELVCNLWTGWILRRGQNHHEMTAGQLIITKDGTRVDAREYYLSRLNEFFVKTIPSGK